MKHLAQWSTPGRGHEKGKLFLAQWKSGSLANQMGHLACFAGGNFLLGGKYLGRPDIVQFGLDVVDACHETYINSITRIGPEYFAWTPADKGSPFSYEPEHSGQREHRSAEERRKGSQQNAKNDYGFESDVGRIKVVDG